MARQVLTSDPIRFRCRRQRSAVRYRRECPPGDQFPHFRIEATGGGVESSEHAPHAFSHRKTRIAIQYSIS